MKLFVPLVGAAGTLAALLVLPDGPTFVIYIWLVFLVGVNVWPAASNRVAGAGPRMARFVVSNHLKGIAMNFAKARLREPSTWAGVAAVVGMGAQGWATRDPSALCAAFAGLLAMFLPEGKPGA